MMNGAACLKLRPFFPRQASCEDRSDPCKRLHGTISSLSPATPSLIHIQACSTPRLCSSNRERFLPAINAIFYFKRPTLRQAFRTSEITKAFVAPLHNHVCAKPPRRFNHDSLSEGYKPSSRDCDRRCHHQGCCLIVCSVHHDAAAKLRYWLPRELEFHHRRRYSHSW